MIKKWLKKIKVAPAFSMAILACVLKIWTRTLRVKVIDPNGILDGDYDTPRIFVTWHNRTLLTVSQMPKKLLEKMCFLASLSRDGGHISALFSRFGMTPVRGSSNREGVNKGGARALVALRRMIRDKGMSPVLTPDGPRGPRYECQPGIVFLAAKAGVPIVPIAMNFKTRFELNNWDRTQFAWPFTYAELIVGDPFMVPAKLDEEQVTEQLHRIRDAVSAVCKWEREVPEKKDSADS